MPNYFDKYDDAATQAANTPPPQANTSANTNYFDKYDTPGQQQANASNQQQGQNSSSPTPPDSGAFQAGLENFNRSFARLAEGTMQIGASGVDAILGTNTRSTIDNMVASKEASAQQAAQNHPTAAMIGGLAGDIGRTVPLMTALPAAAFASPGAMVASGAATNAGINALEAAPTAADRGSKALVGAITGGVGGAAAGLVGSVAGTLVNKEGTGILNKFISPQGAMQSSLLNEAKMAPGGAQAVVDNADAAAAKGINLSPAQAMGTPSMTSSEGMLPIDSMAAKQAINTQNQAMQGKAVGQLNDTVAGMVPNGDLAAASATRDSLYNQLKGVTLNPEDAEKLGITKAVQMSGKADSSALGTESSSAPTSTANIAASSAPGAELPSISPTIQQYVNKLSDSQALPADVAALPLDNAYKLNEVRKLIGSDMMKYSTDETDRIGLKQAYGQLTDALKNSGGDTFNDANKIAQQVILHNQVTDAMQKLPGSTTLNSDGTVDVPLKTLYSRLFGTVEKQNDFIDKITTAGGDAEATQGLIKVIGQLSNPSMTKLATKEIGSASSSLPGMNGGLVQQFVDQTMKGNYNSQLASLLTDNKWVPVLKGLIAKDSSPSALSNIIPGLHTIITGMTSPSAALGAGQMMSNPVLKGAYLPADNSPSINGGLLQQYGIAQ